MFRAQCSPYCSVLLCKTGSQQALCHCNYTFGGLLFKQACSAATPMHCSTGQGKMHSPLFSAALQNRLTACSASLQLQLLRFALHTGVQCCNTKALQHWSGQDSFPTVLCCSAKQANSLLVPLQSHLWRFPLQTSVQCCNTNALQHWSGQNAVPTVQCCSAKQAHRMFVALQLHLWRFALHTKQRSTGQGRITSLLFSTALQNRLTA